MRARLQGLWWDLESNSVHRDEFLEQRKSRITCWSLFPPISPPWPAMERPAVQRVGQHEAVVATRELSQGRCACQALTQALASSVKASADASADASAGVERKASADASAGVKR